MTNYERFGESLRKDGINEVEFLRPVTTEDKRQIYIAFQLWQMNDKLAQLLALANKPI